MIRDIGIVGMGLWEGDVITNDVFGPQFHTAAQVRDPYRGCRGDDGVVRVAGAELVPGKQYTVLVPAVDRDGNDIPGVRAPIVAAPLGTYTGWNLGRKDRFENGMCNLQGSFIPFAATKAERIAAGDPRLSIEERYPTNEAYLSTFKKAASDLVAQRFLLPDDADSLVQAAESEGVRNAP